MKQENQKPESRRFSQDQYEMLKRCSDKKDMTEWNQWREENPQEEIWLEGADISSAYLEGANLSDAHLEDAYIEDTSLEKANLTQAHLEGVNLFRAHLEEAVFLIASLKGADLGGAHLERACLSGVHLEGANLTQAHLKGADFYQALLERANISGAHLEGVNLMYAHLEGADFTGSSVDGLTIIWKCSVDRKTDFRGVGLESCRIDEKIKYLLEYNIRRMNWEEWYPKQNRLLAWLVRKFWEISDYGLSTKQIIKTFFQWALIFAAIYLAWGLIDYHLIGLKDNPGIVKNLFVLEGEQEIVSPWLVPIRAIHFSVVIMTVGFTNMHANAHSFWAHILVGLQMILGFVLLGALVTRFAILFTAGGPAGRFANEKEKKDKISQISE